MNYLDEEQKGDKWVFHATSYNSHKPWNQHSLFFVPQRFTSEMEQIQKEGWWENIVLSRPLHQPVNPKSKLLRLGINAEREQINKYLLHIQA